MPESHMGEDEALLEIPHTSKSIHCVRQGSEPPDLIFSHGAGGTLSSLAVSDFCSGFARISSVLCFQGNMNLKSRVNMFGAVMKNQGVENCLGGRSMGARAAVMAATGKTGFLVLVSYPLQTGKETRDQILLELRPEMEVLFISGDYDSMCKLCELQKVRQKMRCNTWLITVKDADHGLNIKPKEGTKEVRLLTGTLAAKWLEERNLNETECEIGWDAEERKAYMSGWNTVPNTRGSLAQETDQSDKETDANSSRRNRQSMEQEGAEGVRETRSSKRRKKTG